MIQTLKDKNLYDKTLILFTSDHGEYLGHHHPLLKSNYMYDPLVKVPLIVKFPKSVRKGTVSEALVNNTDLAPTILAQAGCAVPQSMRGLNLADAKQERSVTFADASEGRQVMARTKTRKLILDRVKGVNQLYDLEKDPQEFENRYEDPAYQGDVAALKKAISEWRDLDATPKTYLDENARVIDRPNVPDRNDNHRNEMIAYTRGKMKESKTPSDTKP